MRGNRIPWSVIAAAGVVTLIATSCSSDSGKPAPTATITTAATTSMVNRADEYVPGCSSLLPGGGGASLQKAVAADVAALRQQRSSKVQTQGDFPGDCATNPGTYGVTRAHASGVTTYTFTFSNYCIVSAGGGTMTINGNGTLVDVGTPTASGPLISSQTADTDANGITLVRRDSSNAKIIDSKIVLTGYRRTYGVPLTSTPGEPTQAKPNTVTVGRLVKTDNITGEVTTVTELSGSYYKTAGATDTRWTAAVTAGRVETGTLGTVDIATAAAEPIVVKAANSATAPAPQVESGTLVVTGAGGASATVSVGATPNTFTIEVGGTSLVTGGGAAINCGSVNLADILIFYMDG